MMRTITRFTTRHSSSVMTCTDRDDENYTRFTTRHSSSVMTCTDLDDENYHEVYYTSFIFRYDMYRP